MLGTSKNSQFLFSPSHTPSVPPSLLSSIPSFLPSSHDLGITLEIHLEILCIEKVHSSQLIFLKNESPQNNSRSKHFQVQRPVPQKSTMSVTCLLLKEFQRID